MFLIAVPLLLVAFVLVVSRQRRGDRGFSPAVIAAWVVGGLLLVFLMVGVGGGGQSEAEAKVFFTAPLDGSTASSPLIPADATHLHFGKGQTDVKLDLFPGEHTLCLQAGNGSHVALSATDRITVAVAA